MYTVPFKNEKSGNKIYLEINDNINYNNFIDKISKIIKAKFFNNFKILNCEKIEIYPNNNVGINFINKHSAFYVERNNCQNENVSCPICYENNSLLDPFSCSHLVCINCSSQLEARNINRCPLCRSC
tara:strand:- start:80 stop:460 length:381 start_codon:yes stop_codon:yes gene_type:complete